jgi:hypothetical protein
MCDNKKILYPWQNAGILLVFEKFVTTLRLKWLWPEWTNERKCSIGLRSHCNEEGQNLFAVAMIVTTGNGEKANFDIVLVR